MPERAKKRPPERLMFNGLPGTVCRCGAHPFQLCSCTEEERRLPPRRVAAPVAATVESLAADVARLTRRVAALEAASGRRGDAVTAEELEVLRVVCDQRRGQGRRAPAPMLEQLRLRGLIFAAPGAGSGWALTREGWRAVTAQAGEAGR